MYVSAAKPKQKQAINERYLRALPFLQKKRAWHLQVKYKPWFSIFTMFMWIKPFI